jgi:hypothetical protein
MSDAAEAQVMEPVESFDEAPSTEGMSEVEDWGDLDANEQMGAVSEESNNEPEDFDDLSDNVDSNDSEGSISDVASDSEESEQEPADAAKEDGAEEVEEQASEEAEEDVSEELPELPESMQEKGIVQGQDGSLGKMVKIDGEEQFVSLEELGNDYSGQQALSKRFTEMDKREKSFASEVSSIEKYIGDFASKMQNGDVVGAFSYFGEFAGVPSHLIKEQLIAALRPEVERRMGMSEIEIQNEQLQEESNYLKEFNESVVKRREQEQADVELQTSINSVRETHSIDDNEWQEAVNDLTSNPDMGEVTPDNVAEYVVNLRAYDKAANIFESVNVNVESNENYVDALQQIIINNPDFTDEDLQNIVVGSQKQAVKQDVEKKLQSRAEKNARGQAKPEPKAEPTIKGEVNEFDQEIEDWDDLL